MLGTTFLLALRSIARHKLRSFLTILGIIIGVGAVVTMVTLGKATTAAVQASISARLLRKQLTGAGARDTPSPAARARHAARTCSYRWTRASCDHWAR